MQIAFYKGLGSHTRFVDNLVCLGTLSKFSHCEIVFSDGMCASASIRDKGVRFKRINLSSGRWVVYELNLGPDAEAYARQLFESKDGSSYDLIGAMVVWLGLSIGDDLKFFCSEIVALSLRIDKLMSPGGLHRKLLRKGIISRPIIK